MWRTSSIGVNGFLTHAVSATCGALIGIATTLGMPSELALRRLWSTIELPDYSALDGYWLVVFVGCVAVVLLLASRRLSRALGRVGDLAQGVAAPMTRGPRDRRSDAMDHQIIENELRSLLDVVAGYIARNNGYSDQLKTISGQFDGPLRADQIRALVRALIAGTQQASSDVNELNNRLAQARSELSAVRQRLSEAEQQIELDPLTVVANRRGLDRVLEREVQRSHDNETPLCLILADIDYFKSVNDRHGHLVGDEVLRSFAKLLKQCVRADETVARFGGEEFAIVLPRTTSGSAFQVAERARRLVKSSLILGATPSRAGVGITASFGVAEIIENETGSQLLARADEMLYTAKRSGRDRTEIDSAKKRSLLNEALPET